MKKSNPLRCANPDNADQGDPACHFSPKRNYRHGGKWSICQQHVRQKPGCVAGPAFWCWGSFPSGFLPPTSSGVNSSSPPAPHLPTAFLKRSALFGASKQPFLLLLTHGAAWRGTVGQAADLPKPPSLEQQSIRKDRKSTMASLDLIMKCVLKCSFALQPSRILDVELRQRRPGEIGDAESWCAKFQSCRFEQP